MKLYYPLVEEKPLITLEELQQRDRELNEEKKA